MSVFSLIVCLVAIFITFSNRRRIEELERQVSRLITGVLATGPKIAPPGTEGKTAPVAQTTRAPIDPRVSPAQVDSPLPSFSWLRENWLLVIGAMFMVFAAWWLVRYSILHNLIGPVGRIMGTLALGMGIIAVAQRRIRTHLSQGSIFAVLGLAVVLTAIFAGRKYYDMFTPVSATLFMLMAVALVAFMSVRYQARQLSYAGLLMAGAIPLLVSPGGHDFIGLFSHLAVVTAGTLWVVFLTGWRKNVLLALGLVFFYSIFVWEHPGRWLQEPWIGLAVAFGFGLVFFAVSLFASLKDKSSETISDLAAAGLLGVFIIFWTVRVAPHEWQSLVLAAWMLLFSGASYWGFSRTAHPQFFYVYGGVSALLLAAATAVQFSGPTLTLAFIVEAGILPFLVWKILGNAKKTVGSTFFTALPFVLSLNSLRWPEGDIFHAEFFVICLMTVVLAALVYLLNEVRKHAGSPVAKLTTMMAIGTAIATYYAGHLVWKVLHAVLLDDTIAKTLALSLFMLTGLAAYFQGYFRALKPVRIYGGIIVGWVSLRLIFIDMPQMDAGGKVVTFFVLGALLLATAFVERRGRKAIP